MITRLLATICLTFAFSVSSSAFDPNPDEFPDNIKITAEEACASCPKSIQGDMMGIMTHVMTFALARNDMATAAKLAENGLPSVSGMGGALISWVIDEYEHRFKNELKLTEAQLVTIKKRAAACEALYPSSEIEDLESEEFKKLDDAMWLCKLKLYSDFYKEFKPQLRVAGQGKDARIFTSETPKLDRLINSLMKGEVVKKEDIEPVIQEELAAVVTAAEQATKKHAAGSKPRDTNGELVIDSWVPFDDYVREYVALVKISLLDPERFGGWPFRYVHLLEDAVYPDDRYEFMDALLTKASESDDPIMAYAAVTPYVLMPGCNCGSSPCSRADFPSYNCERKKKVEAKIEAIKKSDILGQKVKELQKKVHELKN